MARKAAATETARTYRAKVTGRHAITLPAALCRELAIENGDTVELALDGDRAVLTRVEEPDLLEAARGILKGYFETREDIRRFIEEERYGWEERAAELEALRARPNRPADTSSD